jgi:hypothetical protein
LQNNFAILIVPLSSCWQELFSITETSNSREKNIGLKRRRIKGAEESARSGGHA